MEGYGPVSLVPAGWQSPGTSGVVEVLSDGAVAPHMQGRAYFADACVAGKYDRQHYMALYPLGKTLRYTTDLSGAGCGCNAAFYLVPMRQNDQQGWCRDYYCDANKVCGVSCAEIDVQEANQYAWHSTLHSSVDHNGLAGGSGGGGGGLEGPRDWPNSQYSPGSDCIDTSKPFQVAASFPIDSAGTLLGMDLTLSQDGHSCSLSTQVRDYAGLPELSRVFAMGVTPVVSYWSSNNMRWLDGLGDDSKGPCVNDTASECGAAVRFYDFSIEDMLPAKSPVSGARSGSQAGQPAAEAAEKETGQPEPACPGAVPLEGYGRVALVPAGWNSVETAAVSGSRAAASAEALEVRHGREVVTHLGSRGYFADTCEAGAYDRWQYAAMDLLGKRLRYTTDLSNVGCGCNAALYLVPMRHNTKASKCGDYYCDAGSSCGVSCAEVVIQESNRLTWRSTLRSPGGSGLYSDLGAAAGLQKWAAAQYSPGAECVDTSKPFEVEASFPLDAEGHLAALEVRLKQGDRSCTLSVHTGNHTDLREFSKSLAGGVTPVVSYSADDALLSDSPDADLRRPCHSDAPTSGADAKCGAWAKFYGFSVERLPAGAGSTSPSVSSSASASTSTATPTSTSAPTTSTDPAEAKELEAVRKAVVIAADEFMTKEKQAEVAEESKPSCPGSIDFKGQGKASMVPTGWAQPGGGALVEVLDGRKVVPHMGGRAYFADSCIAGIYERERYLALNLLGKTLRYTTDMSGAGCGCNAALYLVSMRQNPRPSECYDYYCDANNVCGESCDEIDIQEGNMFSWHSTLHTWNDHNGLGGGFGGGGKEWSGPRDWSKSEYGPGGKCIDTLKPIQVSVSFPVDDSGALKSMELRLSQDHGSACSLRTHVKGYKGLSEVSAALKLGMTPVISYWSSNDMLWMDGAGKDGKGHCSTDNATACGESVHFYDFSVEDMPAAPNRKADAKPGDAAPKAAAADRAVAGPGPGSCPGVVHIDGRGQAAIVPAGSSSHGQGVAVKVSDGGKVVPALGGRAYFADKCDAGSYNHDSYVGLKLLGKTLRYTTDVSRAGMSASGCGCNAAFYLVAMRQNERPGASHDYYCDANGASGESCAEIDIQKANKFAWHSTVHGAKDHTGMSVQGGGFDWNGPRDWSSSQYAPGAKCIDTARPFQVAVSFPVDKAGSLLAVEVNLTQAPGRCSLTGRISGYADMPALSAALKAGMTPVISYTSSSDSLLMSGKHLEPCISGGTAKCGDSVSFYDISVGELKHTEALAGASEGLAPFGIGSKDPAEAAQKVLASIQAMQKKEAAALVHAQLKMAHQTQKEADALESANSAEQSQQKSSGAQAASQATAGAVPPRGPPAVAAQPAALANIAPLGAQASPVDSAAAFAGMPQSELPALPQEAAGGVCHEAFQQCGGMRWKHGTCCLTGCKCQPKSVYYSQCIPVAQHAETCAEAVALAATGDAVPSLPLAAPALASVQAPAAAGAAAPQARFVTAGNGAGSFGQGAEEVIMRKHVRGGRVDPLGGRLARSRWFVGSVMAAALVAVFATGVLMRKRAWRRCRGSFYPAGACNAYDASLDCPPRVFALKYSQLPLEAGTAMPLVQSW